MTVEYAVLVWVGLQLLSSRAYVRENDNVRVPARLFYDGLT